MTTTTTTIVAQTDATTRHDRGEERTVPYAPQDGFIHSRRRTSTILRSSLNGLTLLVPEHNHSSATASYRRPFVIGTESTSKRTAETTTMTTASWEKLNKEYRSYLEESGLSKEDFNAATPAQRMSWRKQQETGKSAPTTRLTGSWIVGSSRC